MINKNNKKIKKIFNTKFTQTTISRQDRGTMEVNRTVRGPEEIWVGTGHLLFSASLAKESIYPNNNADGLGKLPLM